MRNKKTLTLLTLFILVVGVFVSSPIVAQFEQLEHENSVVLNDKIFVTEVKYYTNMNMEDVPKIITAVRYQNGKVYKGNISRTNLVWNSLMKYWVATYEGYIHYDPSIDPMGNDY